MTKVWFCSNCGYEVGSRGRCHLCKQRLTASPLPELAPGDEEDEVGYRLEDWRDRPRGRLIEVLIDRGIHHRFEDDELVVAAASEEAVDDIVAEVAAIADTLEDAYDVAPAGPAVDAGPGLPAEQVAAVAEALDQLIGGARRLRVDPTDMEADGNVAEASANVFIIDDYPAADPDTWAAIGRVTRRLLAALGADEALENEIRNQAAILVKLLEPVVAWRPDDLEAVEKPEDLDGAGAVDLDDDALVAANGGGADAGVGPVGGAGDDEEDEEPDGDRALAGDEAAADDDRDDDDRDDDAEDEDADDDDAETVYELPEWMPEQRAQLSLLLEEAGIDHTWDGGDLVVPAERETEVEGLFDSVEGIATEEDDEARYRALEELFAAVSRLAGDPADEERAAEVIAASGAVEGPTPVGLDDGVWWSLRRRTRALADGLDHDAHTDVVAAQAATLRDELRALM